LDYGVGALIRTFDLIDKVGNSLATPVPSLCSVFLPPFRLSSQAFPLLPLHPPELSAECAHFWAVVHRVRPLATTVYMLTRSKILVKIPERAFDMSFQFLTFEVK
jgi:hypothetical protein